MLTTLWTSKSGLNANQEKLDVISNNIANVNTTGYKKVNAGFKDLIPSSLDEWGNPLNDKTATVGSGVITGNFTKDNSQGGLQTTNQMDILKWFPVIEQSIILEMAVLN